MTTTVAPATSMKSVPLPASSSSRHSKTSWCLASAHIADEGHSQCSFVAYNILAFHSRYPGGSFSANYHPRLRSACATFETNLSCQRSSSKFKVRTATITVCSCGESSARRSEPCQRSWDCLNDNHQAREGSWDRIITFGIT